jgi:ubiquinone/menaquinone biosynthesis C-methylase UbiE
MRMIDPRCKFIKSYLPQTEVLLDVGCGDGSTSMLWKDNEKMLIGLDMQKDRLHVAKQEKNLNFMVVGDVTKIGLKDASVDCVIAGEVIEHFKDAGVMLKEVWRILKDGGCLIITTPNGRRLSSRLRKIFGRERKFPRAVGRMQDNRQHDETDMHYIEYAPDELSTTLKKFGFEIEKMRGSYVFDYYNVALGSWLAKIAPSLGVHLVVKARKIK